VQADLEEMTMSNNRFDTCFPECGHHEIDVLRVLNAARSIEFPLPVAHLFCITRTTLGAVLLVGSITRATHACCALFSLTDYVHVVQERKDGVNRHSSEAAYSCPATERKVRFSFKTCLRCIKRSMINEKATIPGFVRTGR
jgi:hypothetical protein